MNESIFIDLKKELIKNKQDFLYKEEKTIDGNDGYAKVEGMIPYIKSCKIIEKHLNKKENKKYTDPLHELNNYIYKYCLKRDFMKRYNLDVSWFDVQILCQAKDVRMLAVIPRCGDSFFTYECFQGKTTKEMFDKAIAFYKEKI